jgi:hypothetical protein
MRGTRTLLGVLVGSAMAVPILAATGGTISGASVSPTNGAIKICKTFVNATPALTVPTIPNATFVITEDGFTSGTVSVPVVPGTTQCALPVDVPSGTGPAVVTEADGFPGSSTNLTAVVQTEPVGTSLAASSLTAGTATVNTANGIIDVVNFTNTLRPGYVEVCKSTPSTSGLTGPFTFTLTGNDGFTAQATATLGSGVTNACSSPIEVPAGPVKAQENGTNLNVIAISATINGATTAAVNGPNLVAANATYTVLPSDIVTKGVAIPFNPQTDITFTDNVVGLEICKVFNNDVNGAGGSLATASYPFTVTPAAGSVAGPAAGFTVSLKPGTCSNPVNFRAGTQVTITEGPVAGTKVQSIVTDGLGESNVSGSPSALNATTTIIIGTPVTGSSAVVPADEAIVTFTNQVADSGQLKICKLAGTIPGPPIGTVFSFTVSGTSVTTLVNLGQCAIVGGSTTPVLFPFNSVQTITEAGSAGNNASAVSVVPTFVNENVGGVATPTTELAAGPTTGLLSQGAALGANATAQVIISEGSGTHQNVSGSTTTEVAFTNVDPPAPGTPVVTVNNPGFNAGTTTGPLGSVSTVATGIGSVLISTPTFSASSSSVVQGIAPTTAAPQTLTAAQKKALLKSENKKLANVKAAITKEYKLIKTATGKALKADHKRLTQLKNEQKLLNMEIQLLK